MQKSTLISYRKVKRNNINFKSISLTTYNLNNSQKYLKINEGKIDLVFSSTIVNSDLLLSMPNILLLKVVVFAC